MARARRATGWTAVASALIALAAPGGHAQLPKVPGSGPARGLAAASEGKQPKEKDPDVPVAYRPPPGMCRVWLAGVPPNQQPAPTDCASAVRNRPSNGRVLFGDDYVPRKSSSAFRAGTGTYASAPGGALSAWRITPALATFDESAVASPAAYPETFAPDSTLGVPAPRTMTPGAVRTAPHSAAQDEYEAGYAAGYRDAMNGRRPRFRGVDRSDPGYGGSAYGSGAYGVAGGNRGGLDAYGRAGSGAVVVVPPGQDPRYFNNGRYPPPGRANGVCLDRDGDGWCDDPRYGAPVCRDLDGDGRCDDYPELAASPYPSSLPEMRAGVDVQQGRGSALALRWLGTAEVVARLVNPKRTGTPYRVLWFDANNNTLLQTWTDLDGDGIADRVEIFRNGRRVKLLGR